MFEQWGWVPSQPRPPMPLDPNNPVLSDSGYEYPQSTLWSTYGKRDWRSQHRGDMDLEDIVRSKDFGKDWLLPNPEGGGLERTVPPVYTQDKMPNAPMGPDGENPMLYFPESRKDNKYNM